MTGDFFDRLEAELGTLTSQGSHLDGEQGPARRHLATAIRRSAVVLALAVVFLAASLATSSITAAGGRVVAVQSPPAHER